MRKLKWIMAAAAVCTLAATAPAIASSHPNPARPAQIHSWSYHGVLSPRDNAHWCLTSAILPTGDHIPVYILPCAEVPPFPWQQWFAGRLGTPSRGVGEIGSIANPEWRLAKQRLVSGAVLTDSEQHPNPRKFTWIIDFTEYKGLWLVWMPIGRKDLYLTVPSHLVFSKKHPIVPQWSARTTSDKWDQLWRINWKENN